MLMFTFTPLYNLDHPSLTLGDVETMKGLVKWSFTYVDRLHDLLEYKGHRGSPAHVLDKWRVG